MASNIEKARASLRSMMEQTSENTSAKMVVEALSDDIRMLLKQGYRFDDIAKRLKENGVVDITPSILQTYLSQAEGSAESTVREKELAGKSCIMCFGLDIAKMPQAIEAKEFLHRDFVPELADFMLKPDAVSVGILQGLCRTGKTTAMLHAYFMLPETARAKCAWLEADENATWPTLAKDLCEVAEKGYKYVFVDEITNVEFFVENSYQLSDNFTGMKGLKICISGTDSLSLVLAKHGPLRGRTSTIRTTWIPFEEWNRLVKDDSIIDYMRWGGLLSRNQTRGETLRYGRQENDGGLHGYFTNFLVRSILNTLKKHKDGEEAGGLEMFLNYDSVQCERLGKALFDGLTEQDFLSIVDKLAEQVSDTVGNSALNAIAMDTSHRVADFVLNKKFEAKDVGSVRQIFGKNEKTERVSAILNKAKEEINKNVRTQLRVEKIPLDSLGYMEFERYLTFMDFLKPKESRVVFPARRPSWEIREKENTWRRENEKKLRLECILCQPAIRYLQLDVQIEAFKKTQAFFELSADEREAVKKRLYEDAEGRMLEDIVHLEVSDVLDNEEIFKAVFIPYTNSNEPKGEFDLVVSKDGRCAIFEIKRSNEKSFYQAKHLRNRDFIERMRFWESNVVSTCVLYRGEPLFVEDDGEFGVEYRNIEEFLSTIRRNGLQDVFPGGEFDRRRAKIPHVSMTDVYDDIPERKVEDSQQSELPHPISR